jgi:polyisoprenoid-binding protein YceI
MLRGNEFLAVDTGPTARYRTTSVRALGNGRYRADGTLALKGLRRVQQVTFTLSGQGPRRTVQVTATLDRTAFAIGTSSSAASLERRVTVTFGFDAVAQ